MTRSWLFIITPSARLSPLTAGTNARKHQLYPAEAKVFVGFRVNVRIVHSEYVPPPVLQKTKIDAGVQKRDFNQVNYMMSL